MHQLANHVSELRSRSPDLCSPLENSDSCQQRQTDERPGDSQETWVRSLGREDPLEEGMATHSSIVAWRVPWTEETGGLQSMESQRVREN